MAKIVAVMACPTGIAPTVMAAEALEKTAKVMAAHPPRGDAGLGRSAERPHRAGDP